MVDLNAADKERFVHAMDGLSKDGKAAMLNVMEGLDSQQKVQMLDVGQIRARCCL
jgi:ABC-type molybdate transport system ATPase subunit